MHACSILRVRLVYSRSRRAVLPRTHAGEVRLLDIPECETQFCPGKARWDRIVSPRRFMHALLTTCNLTRAAFFSSGPWFGNNVTSFRTFQSPRMSIQGGVSETRLIWGKYRHGARIACRPGRILCFGRALHFSPAESQKGAPPTRPRGTEQA
jgi:hypothetical protein